MISGRMARQRLALLTLGFYGTVSVVLCAFGVYAVVTLASRLRRREYAIRVAIGARGRSVRWMVLRHAALLAGTGVAAGLTVAVAGTRVLAGLLHGVAPTDHLTFLVATGGVLGLALASAWWPAHRAGRVDPAEALKV